MDTTKSIKCTLGRHRWEAAVDDWSRGHTCADCGRHRPGCYQTRDGSRSDHTAGLWAGAGWGSFSDGGGGFGGFDGGGCGGDGGGGC